MGRCETHRDGTGENKGGETEGFCRFKMPQKMILRPLLVALCTIVLGVWGACAAGVDPDDGLSGTSGGCGLLSLSEAERNWLREHPVIRVVQDPDWPPVEFVDKQGQTQGLSVDYLKSLEAVSGIKFERVQGLRWSESYNRLKRREVDMTTCLTETEERRGFLSFTKPYLIAPIVILTCDSISYIGTLNELKGKKVAVVDGYATGEWIARDYPGVKQVKVSSVGDGFARLAQGDVYAFVDNMLVLSYYLDSGQWKGLRITGTTPYVYAQSIAVRKDWEPLIGILQKALDAIPDEARDRLYRKWVSVRFGPTFDYALYWKVIAGAALLLAGLVFWNRQLSKEIARRKQAESLQAESEANYRHLFEAHGAVKLVLDPESGQIVDANRSAEAFYGWSRDKLMCMNIRNVNTASSKVVMDYMNKALTGESHFEFQHCLADGSIRDVEVFCSQVMWNGKVCLHSIIHDISDRKRVMMECERLMAAVGQVADGVVITDRDGIIQFVNSAVESATGRSHDSLIGLHLDALKSDEPGQCFKTLQQTLAGGRQWRGRFVNRGSDGRRRISEATLSPVRDPEGRIVNYVSVERDITEHVLLSEQLHQAQKMESVGRLAGGVAHDFNNMLQVILGHVELALDTLGSDHPVIGDLREIEKATRNASTLTRQLLTFARKQPVTPQALDLNDAVSGMIPMISKVIGEAITLSWEPRQGLWVVNMDPVQLKQILVNLCVNARDAIQGVGSIMLETRNVVLDEAYCAVHVGVRCGEYAMIAVCDTGCGMSAEVKAHLFEPFFTTKKAGKGTGLGLAIVYGIVKQNQGDIHIYSEPGQGTVFKIYLPRHVAAKAVVAALAAPAIPIPGNGETVLVVEDEAAILDMVKKLLVKFGYRVLTSDRSVQALRLAAEHAGGIQLLVTDVVMPEMNGKELAERVVALNPEIRVLFMSGYTANVIAHHGVLDAGAHFLQKPFSTVDLAAKVRQALDHPKVSKPV